MGKLNIKEMTQLTPVSEFGGVSIPAFNGKYYCVDLDAYQAHITSVVGEKMKMDGGLSMKFAGFTDAVVLESTCGEKYPEVWYSRQRKMFVFKYGKDFYTDHVTLSSAYNDVSTIRKDKTFLCGNFLYCYDAALGIAKISSIKVVSSLEAPSTDEAASTQLVKDTADDLNERKVEKELGKGLSSEDYTAEEKIKLATIEQGAQKNVLPVQELGDSETDVVSQKVVTDNISSINNNIDSIKRDVYVYDVNQPKAYNSQLKDSYIDSNNTIYPVGDETFVTENYPVEKGKIYVIQAKDFYLGQDNLPCLAFSKDATLHYKMVTEPILIAGKDRKDIDYVYYPRDNGYLITATYENQKISVYDITDAKPKTDKLEKDIKSNAEQIEVVNGKTIIYSSSTLVNESSALTNAFIANGNGHIEKVLPSGGENFKVISYPVIKGKSYIIRGEQFRLAVSYPCVSFSLKPLVYGINSQIVLMADGTPKDIDYIYKAEENGFLFTASCEPEVMLEVYDTIAEDKIDDNYKRSIDNKKRIEVLENEVYHDIPSDLIPYTNEITDAYITEPYASGKSSIAPVGVDDFKVQIYAVRKGQKYYIIGKDFRLAQDFPCLAFSNKEIQYKSNVTPILSANDTPKDVYYIYEADEDGYIVTASASDTYKLSVYNSIYEDKFKTIERQVEDNTRKIQIAKYDISGKNVVVLGDSIMMLMNTINKGSNTITFLGSDGFSYTKEQVTNVGCYMYVTSTLQDGQVVSGSIKCDVRNSYQDKLDKQNWANLEDRLGVNSLYNLGLGGATIYEKKVITAYPYPDGDGLTNCLSNETRWLKRRYDEGNIITPDCIIIWLGTNGAGEPSKDNYAEVMAATWDVLSSDSAEGIALRRTFYGGLRYSLESLYRNFPNATIMIFTPIQTNPENYRTYDKLTTTGNALLKMGKRYSCICVDALNEIGIVDFYENEKNDGTDRWLVDGLHPNSKGKILYANYAARRIKSLFFSKIEK